MNEIPNLFRVHYAAITDSGEPLDAEKLSLLIQKGLVNSDGSLTDRGRQIAISLGLIVAKEAETVKLPMTSSIVFGFGHASSVATIMTCIGLFLPSHISDSMLFVSGLMVAFWQNRLKERPIWWAYWMGAIVGLLIGNLLPKLAFHRL